MGGRGAVATAVAVLCAGAMLFGPVVAGARKHHSPKGRVGGPPSVPLEGPPSHSKNSAALVIGRAVLGGETVELVAHGRRSKRSEGSRPRQQYCVWVEYLPREDIPLECRGSREPLSGGALEIGSQSGAFSPPSAQVWGSLSTKVASVVVTFRRRGGRRVRADVLVAQVRGRLRKRLRQPASFGYFFANVRGRFPVHGTKVTVKAYNSRGHLIGHESR